MRRGHTTVMRPAALLVPKTLLLAACAQLGTVPARDLESLDCVQLADHRRALQDARRSQDERDAARPSDQRQTVRLDGPAAWLIGGLHLIATGGAPLLVSAARASAAGADELALRLDAVERTMQQRGCPVPEAAPGPT